ncbi:hypothetical protein WN944_024662 [Citrus x changshan-huyou]|uniref:Major facilitator superfamily (MFS) profile domain-containing protein n=1 Tax=Citrus x changshan-huyou TaxID=2935761 RepID=A0AAP0LSX9_9ROSI
MAVGLAFTSEGGGQYYNGKMTPFVVLSCIVAATGGLTFGYDLGISGVNESLGITKLAWHDIDGFENDCKDHY